MKGHPVTAKVHQKTMESAEKQPKQALAEDCNGSLLYQRLGARPQPDGSARFQVWAPNARAVSVIGDFNEWDASRSPLQRGQNGFWAGEILNAPLGAAYKYQIEPATGEHTLYKTDPVGFAFTRGGGASQLVSLEYTWSDQRWMANRKHRIHPNAPLAIYEVHLGSWMRVPEENNRSLAYREIGPKLAEHVHKLGFTHVEFLPLMEHPFFGSWGYQTIGYFAPESRYGAPQDLMWLIDYLHQQEIGVFLDWSPSHFPGDEHGLASFDGGALYEYADPRLGLNREWNTRLFDFSKSAVREFLIASALFWLDAYHADGLRVDAVASILYRDYARKPGEWIPNENGGNENWEAVEFLKELNQTIHQRFPDAVTIAEESTAWPGATKPVEEGGLGFDFKWDLGFQHDLLKYCSQDYPRRKEHHGQLTFRGLYAQKEKYILPFSHDEVSRKSLLEQMPGDAWRKFASLRTLLGYMYFQPGKKLLFMGVEFAQWQHWNHDTSLDWHLLGDANHQKFQTWVAHLNDFYRSNSAAHSGDLHPWGFEWVDIHNAEQTTISWLRKNEFGDSETILGVFNFSPEPHRNFRAGVPAAGRWMEILNSDSTLYGGSGQGNLGGVQAAPFGRNEQPFSLTITLPPLAAVFFKKAS
jgi:1,4-alpha-glucan branching enzyme